MKTQCILRFGFGLSLLLPVLVYADIIALSDWDDGTTQGWALGADARGTYALRGSGGNPDGYIAFTDGEGAGNPGLLAPAAFLGDYSRLGPDARFEFDIRVEAGSGDLPEMILKGPGGEAYFYVANQEVTLTWQRKAIPIREDAWQMLSGTWSALVADVTSLFVSLDIVGGGPLDGNLDNFALVGAPCHLSGRGLMRQFPGTDSLTTLRDPFKTQVTYFLASLSLATDLQGSPNAPQITISETYRSPARAYLMHYAYLIAVTPLNKFELGPDGELILKGARPQDDIIVKQPSQVVPAVPDLGNVCWVHMQNGVPDWTLTKQAAQEMTNECCPSGIRRAPAYPSNHQTGEAIDMTITWTKDLLIPITGTTSAAVIHGPTNGGLNKDLHWIGEHYFGVIHFKPAAADRPHWSIDGH